jgi:glycosyltransferase involved in cell wall biosynthesis
MVSIYFVGTYKPIMCGIADYTGFVTRASPAGRWGVISFDPERYDGPLITDDEAVKGRVWYGIPGRHEFSASVILKGLKKLGAKNEDAVLWFQHENGIWPGKMQFIAMLKNLKIPKVVTFHTLHFQSFETPTGLRRNQYDLLKVLLPYVDAITVFNHGVYQAVTSAFPEHLDKVYVMKHGINPYPELSRLSRKEAKEKLNDFLLYESGLDRKTKEALHKRRIFLDSDTVVVGQTGFLEPMKNSELLYPARDSLQKAVPQRRIVAVRIGAPRDEVQRIYAEKLRRWQNGRNKFLLEVLLPQNILPLAQRAFDVNFYWPHECTQSGLLSHALGAGAIVACRDLEGVGEDIKEAGGIMDTDLKHLLSKITNLLLNPALAKRIGQRALGYAREFSWKNQAQRHYELAERILSSTPKRSSPHSLPPVPSIDTMATSATRKSI